MHESGDNELLAQYARNNSEEAFAVLVARHVNLVYSVALRHVANPHQAEEITQVVFLILAKKAGSLSPNTVLTGWLYRTARLTAANYLRMENRRQRREQEAYMQSLVNESQADAWTQIAPILDVAMEHLGNRERNAVLLRFFEAKSLKEVGDALGASEAAAQKSVERALKKLRNFFTRRGVTLSAATLLGVLSTHTVQAAPAGLAESVMSAGITKGAAVSGPSWVLLKSTLKVMTWLKIKTAVVATVSTILIVGTATVTVAQIQKNLVGNSRPSESSIAAASSPSNGPLQVQKIQPSILSKQSSAEPLATIQNSPSENPADGGAAPQGNPQDAAAYLKRGRIYLNQGDYDQAIADFNQVLQLNPKSAGAYFSRGRANKLKGNYEQALADYNEAIQINPQMVAAYVNRGQIYNMADRSDDAIADFNQALLLDPERPIPYLDRGVAYGAKSDYGKAIADFGSALALDPNFSPAYNNLAWLLATCPQPAFRDGKKAVEYATKASELSQWSNINQIDTLAAAYAEAGDSENAVKWESKVLETPNLAPEDAAIAKNRLALYQAHQPYHRKAIVSSPNNQ
jgi:RNA polymerase sigma factor (sigma-70 family)